MVRILVTLEEHKILQTC